MAENININYINKDFGEYKYSLTEFAKTYFPSTYSDFTPSSPGTMFLEMSAYVGDVLSFYLDNQIQENFIQYARQQNNIYSLAYMLGYRPKVTGVATVDIDIYQQVPAVGPSSEPDYSYAVQIAENTTINSNLTANTSFLIQDPVDFSFSSSQDPTTVTIYQSTGPNVDYFLLKKTRKAISAEIKTATFSFGPVQQYPTVEIEQGNIIGILDVTDSDGNKWYEVPYLAQEMIYDTIKNTNINNPNFSANQGNTPFLLQLKKVPRRFVTRFITPTTLQIQFGAGTNTANIDEEITPNPDNVGLGLPYKRSKLTTAFSPTNFLYTDTYGIAPNNTTLTVRYLAGGGLTSNVGSNLLNTITSKENIKLNNGLDPTLGQYVFNSVSTNNANAANGGSSGDTVEQVRLNSLASFATQQRSVTLDDYLVRALSMPSDYGTISKAYIESQKIASLLPGETPSILDLFVLSYDINGNLTPASAALKQNLSTYLSQNRVINDSIKIKNAFIINIGVDFDIIVYPQYNSNEVIFNCINALKGYFDIDNWQINEPIIMKDLYILLDKIEGVQTVKNIAITNKSGEVLGYSPYSYDIMGATRNGTVFPSLDPMIFELKYPNNDIKGKVVSY
jgi:lysophospholipase L1-like esterase